MSLRRIGSDDSIDLRAISPRTITPAAAAESDLPLELELPSSRRNRSYDSDLRAAADESNMTVQLDLPGSPTPRPSPPFSASFFDKDPETTRIRNAYLKALFMGMFITALAILGVLSIFWGALWKVEDGFHHIKGCIVDFDGSTMGQFVRTGLESTSGAKDAINWFAVDASRYPNGPDDVAQAILDESCFMAVSINPNATANLNRAVQAFDGTYNGSVAVTVYGEEARNENSYPILMLMTEAILSRLTAQFAAQHAQQLALISDLPRLLTTAPSVVTLPMGFTIWNVRAFDVIAATAADFVGLIYLLIIAFLITIMNFTVRMATGLSRRLTTASLIRVRLFVPITVYFFLSLIFSLLNLAFQIPFDRRFGRGGFVIFWMLAWLGMCALGLAIEAVVTLLTPRFVPYFLILWIIVNVSVSFFPIELLPGVYHYGYATPFYNISRAARCIIFGTRDDLGLNFGVLLVWIAISLITLPLFQFLMRRREVRAWRASQPAHAHAPGGAAKA